MVQDDIQQDTDLRSRWCRLTYNKTLIYDHDGVGWHTTTHWSTITMVQADIQQHTDLRSRWCRLTYNNTLIYGWHTTRHWSTITMVQADIQQDTDLRSRWCRLTYNKAQIYDHDGQASRHVVSELIGCYSWLTCCSHQVSPEQNAISGLKMSTVITVDWPREWTCSILVDLQQCTDLHKMWYRV